jgi:hypothetical protein
MRKDVPTAVEQIAYTIDGASFAVSLSRDEIYRAVRNGELTLRKRGRRSLILAHDLRCWAEGLPIEGPGTAHAA